MKRFLKDHTLSTWAELLGRCPGLHIGAQIVKVKKKQGSDLLLIQLAGILAIIVVVLTATIIPTRDCPLCLWRYG